MGNIRKVATLLLATIAIAVGVAAPAFAENHRAGKMVNWANGQRSANWTETDSTDDKSRVTFARGCTRDFTATIRKVRRYRPDRDVVSERINCTSYTDALKASKLNPARYHFRINGMGSVCYAGACRSYVTSGKYKITW